MGLDRIVRIAEPTMTRLRDGVGESVHLYVRHRDTRVCVAAIDGKYELRHFTEVGKPLPLSVGASGKLLLAYADEAIQKLELRRAAAKPVSVRAPSAEDLRRQLDEIVATEWSTSFGEREEGLAAAAVPIRDYAGQVIAALTVSGPTARLTAQQFDQLRPQIRAAADTISLAMGWSTRVTPAEADG
jgi:DNA-binding IclR family transcriptional regulator